MGAFLAQADLLALAPSVTELEAGAIIEDLESLAIEIAPCIVELGFPYQATVKAILRQAALRWHRSGEGGVASEQVTSGPFGFTQSFDTRSSGAGRLYPSEERRLQQLCRRWKGAAPTRRQAFTILPRVSR